MEIQHPWQSGPTELINYAIYHLHQSSEFDQRIAFLLLDVGVETLLKTFLQLPAEVTGTKLSYTKRKEASEGKFHELVRGVQEAAGSRLDGIDLTHVQFYHDLRNKLYHQGNGITVPTEKATGYASIAVELLRRLLGVDLEPELTRPQQELRRRQEETEIMERVRQRQESLKQQIHALEQDVRLAIEKVEPAFVMPSFELQVEQWQKHIRARQMMELLSRSLEHDGEVFSEFELLSESLQSMPSALQRFIDEYNVSTSVTVKLALADDILEVLLIIADIALWLPTDPSNATYKQAQLFLLGPPPPFEKDAEDPLARMLRESEELVAAIKEIQDAINASDII